MSSLVKPAVDGSYHRAPIHTSPVDGSVRSPWYPTASDALPDVASTSPNGSYATVPATSPSGSAR